MSLRRPANAYDSAEHPQDDNVCTVSLLLAKDKKRGEKMTKKIKKAVFKFYKLNSMNT